MKAKILHKTNAKLLHKQFTLIIGNGVEMFVIGLEIKGQGFVAIISINT